MNPGPNAYLAVAAGLCVAGCAAALLGEWRELGRTRVLGKLLAGGSYTGAALLWGALDQIWSSWLLAGMLACWAGDLLLAAGGRRGTFLAGLVAFLVGHLAYSGAFWLRGQDAGGSLPAALVMMVFCVAVLRWLWPHVEAKLRGPVIAYVIAISVMLALAAGSQAALPSRVLLAGAVLFVLSDLTVARHRFVAPGMGNRLLGLPLYFLGQWLLAASIVH